MGRCRGGNQRELARQKNMKKQSDSVKGKRRDDGLSAAARKQRVGIQQPHAELCPIQYHLILCALHPLHLVLFALWYLPVPHHLYPQGLGDHAAEAEKGKREEGGTQVALWLRVQPSCPSPVCLEPVPPCSRFLL
ncbi:small EDRK-rich factor 2 isoform X2 [Marmota marmota marmota]|uniref:small EDRK-rich factor 2 isoform X2 n=1 Tax=Marmota marmota marmota TaxID=9994 RepID=UPI002093616A|nr:small EDRK-rich factor 2 isoform X2 [Marmota marmota marmota]